MSGSCIVTPGHLLADGETLTEAKLRQIASPAVKVAEGSISDKELNLPAVQAALGAGSRPNLFLNGGFLEWRWGASALDCPPGVDTWNAEGWCVRPTGGTVQYAKGAAVPPNALSLNGVRLLGGAGVTTCQLAQFIDRSISSTLKRNLTFSGWLYNNTGQTHTPKVILSTCNTPNSWSDMTVQMTRNLDPCPNAAWTSVATVLDCATLPGIENGMRVAIEWPAPSLNASGKTWDAAQLKLEVGEAATAMPVDAELSRRQCVGGQSTALIIANNVEQPNYKVDATGEDVVLRDARGFAVLSTFHQTADMTLEGLGGIDSGAAVVSKWYYLFAVSNGGETHLLFSRSYSNPAVPAGYPYRALLGAVYNQSDGTLRGSYQRGRNVILRSTISGSMIVLSTSAGANVWYPKTLEEYIPPIAISVSGFAGSRDGNIIDMAFSSEGTGLGVCYVLAGAASSGQSGWRSAGNFTVQVITPQTIYYRSGWPGNHQSMQVQGYCI